MQRTTFLLLCVIAAPLCFAPLSRIQATPVPITNPGFDATNNTANGGGDLAVDQYTLTFGTGVNVYQVPSGAPLGTTDVLGFSATGNAGIQYLDPATYYAAGGAPPSQPTGYLFTGGQTSGPQSIFSSPSNILSNTQVQPNSTYTMTLQLYERKDLPLPDHFTMELLAGGVDLGGTLTVVNPTTSSPGSATLVVTTGSTVNGGALSFQATISLDSGSSVIHQLNFDNLTLDVESVPEPQTWALILGGIGTLVALQRHRGARASGEHK
ncbi:MAG: hypothetical protein JO354_04810 [Verrucomicrobia bacterium]|nr:hypothetical protein [Verrucomicrobiota bacterium]